MKTPPPAIRQPQAHGSDISRSALTYTELGRIGSQLVFVEERGPSNNRYDAGERIGIRNEAQVQPDRFVNVSGARAYMQALGIVGVQPGVMLSSVRRYANNFQEANVSLAKGDYHSACGLVHNALIDAQDSGVLANGQALWRVLRTAREGLSGSLAHAEEEAAIRPLLQQRVQHLRGELMVCEQVMQEFREVVGEPMDSREPTP